MSSIATKATVMSLEQVRPTLVGTPAFDVIREDERSRARIEMEKLPDILAELSDYLPELRVEVRTAKGHDLWVTLGELYSDEINDLEEYGPRLFHRFLGFAAQGVLKRPDLSVRNFIRSINYCLTCWMDMRDHKCIACKKCGSHLCAGEKGECPSYYEYAESIFPDYDDDI